MTQDELDKLVLAIGRNVLLAQKEVLTLEEVARYTGLKKKLPLQTDSGKGDTTL